MQARNKVVGVFSHVDAGKTTLMEAILYKTNVIRELGQVDSGTSFMDREAVEIKRGITFSSKPVHFQFKQQNYTFIDTPGHMDLTFEMEKILQVADVAIILVSAVDGVTGYTETIFELCQQYLVPVLIFVNKTDSVYKNIAETEKGLVRLSSKIIPYRYDDSEQLHILENTEFCEDWAVLDEEWFTILTSEQTRDKLIVNQKFSNALLQQRIVPYLFGSALQLKGITALLELLNLLTLPSDSSKKNIAQVYKISHDAKGTRYFHTKIISGTFSPKDKLTILAEENPLKINQLFFAQGTDYKTTSKANAGDIVAITGLNHVFPGDFFGSHDLAKEDLPESKTLKREPILEVKVFPKAKEAYNDLLKALQILSEEDPTLKLRHKQATNDVSIRVAGTIQMEYLKEIFLERFQLSVEFSPPDILYQETIARPVIGYGHFEPLRHYAEVALLLEPGDQGQGIIVKNDCPKEQLEINYQKGILHHIQEKMHLGVLTGSPITDLTITLLSGKAYHPETKGGDFREATYRAIRQGLMKSDSLLLEPWYSVKISVPTHLIGKVSSDIEKMSGKVLPSISSSSTNSTIEGEVPVANFLDYPLTFASFAKNQGRITTSLKGYFPCKNQAELVAHFDYHPENDLANTANSIFFKKGKGYDVHWREVDDLHHINLD